MKPYRGEIWLVNPDFVIGNEQAHIRPALVVSDDRLNQGPAGLSLVVPCTSRVRNVASHVPLAPPEGGLTVDSALMCEQLRALSHGRFKHRMGQVTRATLASVDQILRRLLVLP